MKIKRISCPVCCESHFNNLTILRDTLVAVTTKYIQCPVCNEQVSGLDKFTIHLFTHRDVTPVVVDEKSKTLENKIEDTKSNEITITVQSIPNLQNIIQNNNQSSSHTNTIVFDNNTTSVTQPVTNVRCEICNITFSDNNILEMHKKLLHTNGFSCHLCHKRFKMQGSLMVHMRVAHYGFGQIVDNENGILKGKAQDIKTRTALRHVIDNKQWECDVCLKKFTTKYFLKKHKRLHTGEMPYVCGLCGKSFTFQQSYHKHMLYHSEDKPHTCNECGRAFKELSTLHNHQRIHSGERPFACETCGKCFRQRVSYLVHRRIHTGAMPYKCTSCDKRFRYKVSQRTHKCKAQPPGAVVRQFGDLVQRLLLQQTQNGSSTVINDTSSTETTQNTIQITQSDNIIQQLIIQEAPAEHPITSNQITLNATENEANNFVQQLLMQQEHSNNNDILQDTLNQSLVNLEIPSTSEHCSTVNEECLKRLLYDTSDVT